MPAVFPKEEVEVDGGAAGELGAAVAKQADVEPLAHLVKAVTLARFEGTGEIDFAFFRGRRVGDRIGAKDRDFGESHAFGIERRPLGGSAIEPRRFFMHVLLPALAEHFLHDADELHLALRHDAPRGHDLGAFDGLLAIDPEVEDAAGRFVAGWSRDAAERRHRGRLLGEIVVEVGHGSFLRKSPAWRYRRFTSTGSGVKSGLRASSARTIGSSDTGMRA